MDISSDNKSQKSNPNINNTNTNNQISVNNQIAINTNKQNQQHPQKVQSRNSVLQHIMILKDTTDNVNFTNEDIDNIMDQIALVKLNNNLKDDNNNNNKIQDLPSTKEHKHDVGPFLFERNNLILKILRFSKDKFQALNEKSLAKGIDWIVKEIQDSMIFKSDDKVFRILEQHKKNNADLETVFLWLEEYSSMKGKYKEHLELVNDKNNDNKSVVSENESLILGRIKSATSSAPILDFSEEYIARIEEPNFNIFELEKEIGEANTLSTVSCYTFITLGLYSQISYSNFERVLVEITKGYNRKNLYHTDLHAADVEQTLFMYLKYGKIAEIIQLNNLDIASLLIAAIIHDYKHPGFSNGYLINTKDDLSIQYNDVSVLENFHVSEAFKLFNKRKEFDIFSEMSKDEYKLMRKRIVDCVLATDMSFHTKQYSYLKMKAESLDIAGGKNVGNLLKEMNQIQKFEAQQELLNILLHTADISNPTKPWNTYQQWVEKVMGEFWVQGDKEKQLGIPVSFLCDRKTTKVPNSQIGFMDGIVLPLLTTVCEYFLGLNFLLINCKQNKEIFIKQKEQEETLEKIMKRISD